MNRFLSTKAIEFEGVNKVHASGRLIVIPPDRLLEHFLTTGNESMLRDAFLVPDVCADPHAIFEGYGRVGQSDALCYTGFPAGDYAKTHGIEPVLQVNRVLLVFMTEAYEVTKWRWCEVDPDGSGYPVNHQKRFGRRLWPMDSMN